jgi:hypothetical protein
MSHQHATIEDTVYFYFASNDTSGSGGDGATPLFDVREAGAAASAAPLLSGTPTLLTHANYPAGCHEIAVAATVANGFAADDTFGVFCTLAIDSQNPTGFVGSCTLTSFANAVWDEPLTKSTHNVAQSGGKRLRQIDSAFEVHSGTAQAGTTNTITFDTGASSTDNIYRGDRVVIVDGTGAQEHGLVTSYNGTTKVATMSENWVITPDATSDFEIVPADADVETWQHIAVSNNGTTNLPAVDSASAVWSDTLTTYTDGMAGKRVRGITIIPSVEGTVNDVSATTTSFITTLTGYGDDFFNDSLMIVEIATDQWQPKPVATYTSTTGTFTFDEPFISAPGNGVAVAILSTHIHTIDGIADGILDRDMSVGTDSGSPTVRTVRQALRFLRNKWAVVGTTLTVNKEDDTTASWTATVSTDAAADPVTGSDPA